MQEWYMPETVCEMKRYLKWASQNVSLWGCIWDGTFQSENTRDQIEMIEELQKAGRYPQILDLALNCYNEMQTDMIQSIMEEIAEIWDQKQWDEVIEKLLSKLRNRSEGVCTVTF